MDQKLFFETRHGREAKGLVLRCLLKLVGCSSTLIGGQVGDIRQTYVAYRKATTLVDAVNNWIRPEGYMSLPVGAETFVGSAIEAVRDLLRFAQGADPGMAQVREDLESVVAALTELPQYIRQERQRQERLRPPPSPDTEPPPARRGGDGPW